MSTRQDLQPSDRADISRLYQVLRSISDLANPNMDQCRWIHLYHQFTDVLMRQVAGDVVELGCHEGHTAIFLQKILDSFGSDRRLHVYDSFQGLPERTPQDAGTAQFLQPGTLVTTPQAVLDNFAKADVRPPEIHAGWFHETLSGGLPEQIAFAHLDGDFYDSILVSLRHVYPRLSTGAVVVVDDYTWSGTPGAKRACDEFFADKPERIHRVFGSTQGTFRKQPSAGPPSPCVDVERTLGQLEGLIGDLF